MSYFGDLVKALREAQQDTNLRKWTRPQMVQELAKVQQSAEDYTVKVIENIESGHTRPTVGMLSDLVKAFRMTRLEAKEFFSAALSPTPEVTSETEKADAEILAQQLSLLKDIRLPGFLTDYYGDII